MKKAEFYTKRFLAVAKDNGYEIKPNQRVLDLGCGGGNLVKAFLDRGYNCYGCDIGFDKTKISENTKVLLKENRIRLIQKNPYQLSFPDNSFDLVVSHMVFEHVKNTPEVLEEIKRVLKPRGISLHTFPPKSYLMEAHIHVPLGSMIQKYWWIYLWAIFGSRRKYQKGFPIKVIAKENYIYLKTKTNYLSLREIKKLFNNCFSSVIFCEKEYLKHTPRLHFFYSLSKFFPFIPFLIRKFHHVFILTKK